MRTRGSGAHRMVRVRTGESNEMGEHDDTGDDDTAQHRNGRVRTEHGTRNTEQGKLHPSTASSSDT